jgi:hypothetical protein
MHKFSIYLSILLLALFLAGCAGTAAAEANEIPPTNTPEKVQPTATPEVLSRNPPTSCPVTVPQDPAFVPPAPYDSLGFEGYFWSAQFPLGVAATGWRMVGIYPKSILVARGICLE